jgi:hypothetical protein
MSLLEGGKWNSLAVRTSAPIVAERLGPPGEFPIDLRILTEHLALFRTKVDGWAIKSVLLPLKGIEL